MRAAIFTPADMPEVCTCSNPVHGIQIRSPGHQAYKFMRYSHARVTCIMVQLILAGSTSSATWLTRAAMLDTCSSTQQTTYPGVFFNADAGPTHSSAGSWD